MIPRLNRCFLELDGDDKTPVRLQHVHHYSLLLGPGKRAVQTPVTDRREPSRPASLGDVGGRPDVWHEDSSGTGVRRLLYAATVRWPADSHEYWCWVRVTHRRLHCK